MLRELVCLVILVVVACPELGRAQSEPQVEPGEKTRVLSLVVTSSSATISEFIVLAQDTPNTFSWKILGVQGQVRHKGRVATASGASLDSLLQAVKSARTSELDKNPQVPAGGYYLLIYSSEGVSALKLTLAQQQALVMSDSFQDIRKLPYMDKRGGGGGGFYPMYARFFGPLRVMTNPPDESPGELPKPTDSLLIPRPRK